VNKTRRSPKTLARKPKDSANDSSKRGAQTRDKGAAAKVGSKAGTKPGGIPVRGARKSAVAAVGKSGVRTKPPAGSPPERTVSSKHNLDEARTLALAAIEAALDKKALMPVLIDVSAMASYTDFIGIVSGRSDRQVDAIADNISQFMKAQGRHILGHEGSGSGRWTLLDFGEIVIHVFYHPVREFYDLESLWIDAPRVKMHIPPEAILTQPDALYGNL
jgi:ribosome-associated protein